MGSEVVLEATYGWYWAADVLEELGATTCTWPTRSATTGDTGGSRTTSVTPRDLADMLRIGRLAEAWIAPPPVRELRELVRYRDKLVPPAHRAQGPGPRGAWPKNGDRCRRRATCGVRAARALLDRARAAPRPTPCASSRCAT